MNSIKTTGLNILGVAFIAVIVCVTIAHTLGVMAYCDAYITALCGSSNAGVLYIVIIMTMVLGCESVLYSIHTYNKTYGRGGFR